MKTAPRRLKYEMLDVLRGVAALWVVLLHAYGSLETKISIPHVPGLADAASLGWLGVQIFFVISGFCIAASAVGKEPLKFAKARLQRIYPPYFGALILFTIVGYAGYYLVQHGIVKEGHNAFPNPFTQGISYWISNLTLTNYIFNAPFAVGVAWSLAYEISFYAFMLLFLLIKLKHEQFLGLCHLLTFVCIGLLIAGLHVPAPFDLWPQFGLGILLYEVLSRPSEKYLYAISGAVCALFLVYAAKQTQVQLGPEQHNESPVGWVMTVFVFLLLAVGYSKDKQVMKFKPMVKLGQVGIFSYSLYLVHFVLIFPISLVALKLHLHGIASLLMLCVTIAFSIAGGYVYFKLVEEKFIHRKPTPLAPPETLEIMENVQPVMQS